MKKALNAAEVPVVICSLFTLKQEYQWWAFRKMGFVWLQLARAEGLQFGKMLGIGNGRGFSMKPDFGRYMLLTC